MPDEPNPPQPFTVKPVSNDLPPDLSDLQADAAREGYGFIDRLVNDWASKAVRFDKPGEALLIARQCGSIAGIGGVTEDPFVANALRMRRFYIRPGFRRRGIAQALAKVLLDAAIQTGRPITINAGTAVAPAFWESLGCIPVNAEHHTHIWPMAD